MTGAAKKKQNAYNALESWMDQQPRQTNSAYESALDAAVNALEGQKSFSSGYSAGTDPNARAWRQDYAASLTNGANTAAAQTAALSGGYGAGYAASAANQTAQLAAPQGIDVEQMLRSLASGGYKANAAANQAAVDAMLADLTLAQSADQMNQDNWAAYRDILAGQASAAADEELGFWGNLWSTAKQLAQAGMDIYDGVKGYQQQNFENALALAQMQYGMNRDGIEDARYAQEYADSRADVDWQQQFDERAYTDSRADTAWEQAMEERAYQDSRADVAYERALAAQAAAAGYGSGGSGGSSGGNGEFDFDLYYKTIDKYRELMYEGEYDMAEGVASLYKMETGVDITRATDMSSIVSLARSFMQQGYTGEEVVNYFRQQGFSDERIAEILNQVR